MNSSPPFRSRCDSWSLDICFLLLVLAACSVLFLLLAQFPCSTCSLLLTPPSVLNLASYFFALLVYVPILYISLFSSIFDLHCIASLRIFLCSSTQSAWRTWVACPCTRAAVGPQEAEEGAGGEDGEGEA